MEQSCTPWYASVFVLESGWIRTSALRSLFPRQPALPRPRDTLADDHKRAPAAPADVASPRSEPARPPSADPERRRSQLVDRSVVGQVPWSGVNSLEFSQRR